MVAWGGCVTLRMVVSLGFANRTAAPRLEVSQQRTRTSGSPVLHLLQNVVIQGTSHRTLVQLPRKGGAVNQLHPALIQVMFIDT